MRLEPWLDLCGFGRPPHQLCSCLGSQLARLILVQNDTNTSNDSNGRLPLSGVCPKIVCHVPLGGFTPICDPVLIPPATKFCVFEEASHPYYEFQNFLCQCVRCVLFLQTDLSFCIASGMAPSNCHNLDGRQISPPGSSHFLLLLGHHPLDNYGGRDV